MGGPSARGDRLVHYSTSRTLCVWSVVMALVATALVVAGFVNMATFQHRSAIGIWAGLSMFVPIALGLVVMASRQKKAVVVNLICNLIVLAACVYSTYVTAVDIDTWDTFRTHANEGRCQEASSHCTCTGQVFLSGYTVSSCDLFSFGHELNWVTTVLAAVGAFCCLVAVFVSLTLLGLSGTAEQRGTRDNLRRQNTNMGFGDEDYQRRETGGVAYYGQQF